MDTVLKQNQGERRGKSRETDRKRLGMSEMLILYITVFFAVAIAVLWIFQSLLLDDFYRAEKKRDSLSACSAVMKIASTEQEDAHGAVESISEKYGVCVSAYIMGDDGSAELVADKHVLSHCTLHNTNIRSKYTIYEAAKKKDNVFFQYFTYDREKDVFNNISESETVDGSEVTMVYAKIYPDTADNGDTMIIVDTVITPVGAVVRTVRVQLAVFTAVFIVIAVVFGILLARKFTLPIKRLNQAAANFGGDGGFSVGGYKEIKELSDTLGYASAELEKTERLRRELIANVSHDLKTPLTMLIGYGEMMRDIPGESTPENAANIVAEAERMNRLVSDLTELSRVSSGAALCEKRLFSLTERVAEQVRGCAEMLGHDGYRISFLDGGVNASVESDPFLVDRVIRNFLMNAVAHVGEDRSVWVRQIVSKGWVTVAVTDTGEGIPADKLEDIWERYYKVNSAHSRGEGSGLGLSIVKAIMLQLGGHYGVESTVGKGSTFWFALPLFIGG